MHLRKENRNEENMQRRKWVISKPTTMERNTLKNSIFCACADRRLRKQKIVQLWWRLSLNVDKNPGLKGVPT